MTIAEDIAKYVGSVSYRDIPENVVHAAKVRIIDDIGCAIAGSVSKPGMIAAKSVQDSKGPYLSTILGTKRKADPSLAAFVNGAMARYLDFNDTYDSKELSHPSDNIMPVLAVAEAFGRTGKDALLGVVLAYELQCRMCDAANLWKLGWDHVIYGLISIAGASSRLMDLDDGRTTQAINISLNSHLTMRQLRSGQLSMWKAPAFSNSARNAIFSTMLAMNGMTGPAPVFEGDMGFWKQVTGKFNVDTSRFGGKRGSFRIKETLIKHYPAEVRAQTAITSALEARKAIGGINGIKSIEIGTNEAGWKIIGRGYEKWHPKTKETADHSLPYVVAVSLLDGKITTASYSEGKLKDSKVASLMGKTTVVERREYTRLFNKGGTVNAADVVIKMNDGTVVREKCIYSKGHPRNPMGDSDIEEKFMGLAMSRIGRERSRKILRTVWSMEDVKDISKLLSIVS